MTIKLLDLYKSILDCAGMDYDDEGFVFVKIGDERKPARTSDGKQIVLPTMEQQRNGDNDKVVLFHPLRENIMRSGESDIISKLRSVFNIKLNYTFGAIGVSLLTLCASIEDHKKLSPDQSEILSIIKGVDSETVKRFIQILKNTLQNSPEKGFVNIYLNRKAIFNNVTYARGGVVTFPLYTELKKDQDRYAGVRLRTKDKAALIELYKYIFPCIDEQHAYNCGSNSEIAPFIDSLMKTVASIASKYNTVLSIFDNIIDASDTLMFDYKWFEHFENLQDFQNQIRSIPMQAGNEGSVVSNEVNNNINHNTQQPLAYQQPMNQQNFFPQQNGMQNKKQDLIVTENGISFDSYLRTNPQIAAAVSNTNQNSNFNTNVNYANDPTRRTPNWLKPENQMPMNNHLQVNNQTPYQSTWSVNL